jgi:hypothetical protein
MSLPLDVYRTKLVNKILNACSGENAQRFAETALKTLERRKVNGYIIARFIDKVINQLELYNPLAIDACQWNNVLSAKQFLYKKREELLNIAR